MKPAKQSVGRDPYLIMLGHICADLNQGALPALLPFLIAAHGMNYSTAASLIMACNCISSIVQPFFGHLADKITAPAIMAVGVLLGGAGLAGIGLAQSYWAMFTLVVISGIGIALFHPEAGRTINRISGERKGTAMGIFSVGGSLGFAVGPLLVTLLIPRLGVRGTVFLGIPALLMALALFSQSGRLRRIAAQADGSRAGRKDAAHTQKDNWKGFSILTGVIFCRSIVMYGLIAYIPLYWVGVFMQSESAGSTRLTMLTALGVISTLTGGRLADAIGFNKIIRIGCTAVFPVLLLFSFTENALLATLLLLPMGLVMNLSQSPAIALGQKFLPNHIGVASGVSVGLAVSVGGITSPLLGKIGDSFGLGWVILTLSAVSLLAAVFSYFVPKAETPPAAVLPSEPAAEPAAQGRENG